MAFTDGNDVNILQSTDTGNVGAGLGDDKYILDASQLDANQQITISDADGDNILQLVGGLTIASSLVTSNAIRLTLNNGSIVTVLGANAFTYITSGDSLTGVGGLTQNFSDFVTDTLELDEVPAPGESPVSGGPVDIPDSSGNGGSASITADIDAQHPYEFTTSGGDGAISLTATSDNALHDNNTVSMGAGTTDTFNYDQGGFSTEIYFGANFTGFETFNITGSANGPASYTFREAYQDGLAVIDASGAIGDLQINVGDLDTNGLTVTDSAGDDIISMHHVGVNATVNLSSGGDDKVTIDTGNSSFVVTVNGFITNGTDQVYLNLDVQNVVDDGANQLNSAIDTAAGDPVDGIDTTIILSGANFEVTDLSAIASGGTVRTAIIDASLQDTALTGGIDGNAYVLLDDGIDTGIYRMGFDTTTGGDVDFIDDDANISNLTLVGILDNVVTEDMGSIDIF